MDWNLENQLMSQYLFISFYCFENNISSTFKVILGPGGGVSNLVSISAD